MAEKNELWMNSTLYSSVWINAGRKDQTSWKSKYICCTLARHLEKVGEKQHMHNVDCETEKTARYERTLLLTVGSIGLWLGNVNEGKHRMSLHMVSSAMATMGRWYSARWRWKEIVSKWEFRKRHKKKEKSFHTYKEDIPHISMHAQSSIWIDHIMGQ